MYQKIKDSLFYPKRLATSYQSKTIWFLIFMIVLSALPFILYTAVNGVISSNDIRNAKRVFFEEPVIEYKIENNQLIPYEVTTNNRYVVIKSESIGVAFVNNPNETITVNEYLVIVFDKDAVFLQSPNLPLLNYKVADYSELNGIDFKDAKDYNNDVFWNTILGILNNKIDKMKFIIYPVTFITIIMQFAISIVLGILFNTILLMMFERVPGVSFKEVYKNSTVAFFPYVITTILAYAFNLAIIQYLGNIISFIYALIAHNEYRKMKYKEIR
ncbi:MAG: DUF1189 family protein [Bacilli bacterium]|nr:DUF1189 family protein [Bacilli bacterium]